VSDVWIAALRKGIPHHAISGERTRCERRIGQIRGPLPDGHMRIGEVGWVLSEERSVADFASKPCPRCFPTHDTEAR
jgi:hypothetical protein